MIDWYYPDPAGRVGPFVPGELRKRFHEPRIGHDTLVWLREWELVQCKAEEVSIRCSLPTARRYCSRRSATANRSHEIAAAAICPPGTAPRNAAPWNKHKGPT
jgi:hypothetical protein